MIADAQMVALGFNVRIHDLIIEKLRGLWTTRNAPVVEIEQAPEKRELPLPIQDLDLYEIRELANECPHALIEAPNIALDLVAQ